MSDKKASKKFISDKRAANLKAFSIGSAFLLFAIILVVNILLYVTLNDRLLIDTSSTAQNSITEQTQAFLDNIPSDKNIRIVGLFDEPKGSEITNAYEFIVPMLKSLEVNSHGKVSVEYVNPNIHPTIVNELDPDSVSDIRSGNRLGQYAVCCDGKIRFVDPTYDCFTIVVDESGAQHATANKAESAFVNAMLGVTTESKEKAYFLSDIQGSSHVVIDGLLESMNIEIADLSVNTDNFSIPDDCSMLFILSPNVDISESVQEAIKDYIWHSSHPVNIFVTVGINAENAADAYPHLNNVLNEVNLALECKNVADDDMGYLVSSENGIFKADLVDDFIDNTSTGYVLYRLSRNVVNYGSPVSGIVTKPIARTSSTAELISTNEFDENGQNIVTADSYCNVAMVAYSEGMDQQINVFVFGSDVFTADYFLGEQSSNSENMQFLRSTLSHITISDDQYIIPAKDMQIYAIDSSKVDQNSVSAFSIIFLVGIPMVFIFAAWFVYYKRSHL